MITKEQAEEKIRKTYQFREFRDMHLSEVLLADHDLKNPISIVNRRFTYASHGWMAEFKYRTMLNRDTYTEWHTGRCYVVMPVLEPLVIEE